MLWRVQAEHGRMLCLRRWPLIHPSPERLRLIHNVLRIVGDFLPVVAAPLPAQDGKHFRLAGRTFMGAHRMEAGARRLSRNAQSNTPSSRDANAGPLSLAEQAR